MTPRVVGVGTVRHCTLATPLLGWWHVEEELIGYVPGWSLTYRLRGPAGPFRVAIGAWLLRPHTGGTVVEVSGVFEPRNAMIGLLLGRLAQIMARGAARRAMRDLARFIEQGSIAAQHSDGIYTH